MLSPSVPLGADLSTATSLDESATKRRKLRKGTFSCWECKRRKIRCDFRSKLSASCTPCRRRGSQCITQHQPEEDSEEWIRGRYDEVAKRIVHVEALVDQLVRQTSSAPTGGHIRSADVCKKAMTSQSVEHGFSVCNDELHSNSRSAQATTGCVEPAIFSTLSHSPAVDSLQRDVVGNVRRFYSPLHAHSIGQPESHWSGRETLFPVPGALGDHSLSRRLYSFFPSPDNASLIMRRGKFTLPIQTLRQPYRVLPSSSGAQEAFHKFTLPPPNSPPAALARQLLQLAISLQRLDKTSDISDLNLRGHPRDIANYYFEAASHVTSQDLLVSSLTGLEALMMEGLYQFNLGNIRLASLKYRRALGIASLMGLHIPQQQVDTDHCTSSAKEFAWFRLVYGDRSLSLMLSNPLSIMDNSFASEHLLATEVPLGKLERMHAVIMGHIITRNHRMRCEGMCKVYAETQEIDYELKRAMRSLPLKWWIIPSLSNTLTDVDIVEETAKLLAQINQHYLLVLLHMPYIMRRADKSTTIDQGRSISTCFNVTYSKSTTLNSSREILSRFFVYRTLSHVPFCCHGADFKAFCASMTLLLAHLEGHLLGRENMLEHQRPTDLAMVEHVIESMENMARLKHDMISASSAQILRKLVEIEEEAADGVSYMACSEDEVPEEGYIMDLENHSVKLSVPYFGTIRIVRRG